MSKRKEFVLLALIGVIIFFLSTLQVKDILSIWNQNDEFGVWQGGAWILGLDWSEVVSTNGYYGHGYGFILALFIKIWGNNTVFMTHMAIYFQALIHVSCIFIARYCIAKLFPKSDIVTRVIASTVCILNIPDLFYIYMFFSESWLRLLVWIIFGLVVSYYDNPKWYKLLLVAWISIYSFSVHQRCILLVAEALVLIAFEIARYFIKNGFDIKVFFKVSIVLLLIGIFYFVEYKYGQNSYINALYRNGGGESVGSNLLSERGFTLKGILLDYFFNKEAEKIAIQNMFGMIYYICAFDCGFFLFGVILCVSKIKRGVKDKNGEKIIPFLVILCTVLLGILLVVYQNANGYVYSRVEIMHYGRYCSYLLTPMFMLGIVYVLTEKENILIRNTLYILLLFLLSGTITYTVLKTHNVTNLFAFANACPGIKSVYYTDNPFTATLYHTVLGVIWILFPIVMIVVASKHKKVEKQIRIGIFIIVAITWIYIANEEWNETHKTHNVYVVRTYDLQSILREVDEFVAFKSFSYGSGLLQYNNPYSKIHVCQTLEEFDEEENGLLVVSQKGIEEMEEICKKYNVEYENDRYFVWKYEIGK